MSSASPVRGAAASPAARLNLFDIATARKTLKAVPAAARKTADSAAPGSLVRALPPPEKHAKSPTGLDKYVLGIELGAGARGRVYAATRPDMPDAAFAIKIVPEAFYDGEDAVLLALSHPNVLPILESFQTPVRRNGIVVSEWCYVLPLASGGDLVHYAAHFEGGVLNEEAFWHSLLLLASGLDYLHGMSIIHSDIKPQNVLLHGRDGMMLADFGTARKHVGADAAGEFVGTFAYMAPETFESFVVSEMADLWSLGASFFTLLTGPDAFVVGRGPAATDARQAAATLVRDGGVWVPPELPPGPHLSDELRALVRRMLAWVPSERPTPAELLQHPRVREARVRADAFANPTQPTTALGIERAQTVAAALERCGWSTSPLSYAELDDLSEAFKLLARFTPVRSAAATTAKLPREHISRRQFCHVLHAATLSSLLDDELLDSLEVGHHSGVVSWVDFVSGVAALSSRAGKGHEEHLVLAFRSACGDGTHRLTRTEVEDFFIGIGMGADPSDATEEDTPHLVDAVFKKMDENGDGILSVSEFQALVANTKPCSVCGALQPVARYSDHYIDCVARVFGERAHALSIEPSVAALFEPISHAGGKRREAAPPSDNAVLIDERLWLGNQWAATGEAFVKMNSIRGIVNVAQSEARTLSTEERAALGVVAVRSEDVYDVVDVDATESIVRAADAVHELLGAVEPPGAVLVHCVQGISRSAATAMAYFVRHGGKTLRDAAATVRAARWQANPNLGFWKSLRRIEIEKRGASTVPEEALKLHSSVVLLKDDAAAAAVDAAGTPRARPHAL